MLPDLHPVDIPSIHPPLLKMLGTALLLVVAIGGAAAAENLADKTGRATSKAAVEAACKPCIRANMEFLASDALQGRGSATHDEWVAATYIATEMKRAGLEPAGENTSPKTATEGFLQRIKLQTQKITAPPKLIAVAGGAGPTLVHGTDFYAFRLAQARTSGPLQKLQPGQGEQIQAGAFALLAVKEGLSLQQLQAELRPLMRSGAALLMVPVQPAVRKELESEPGRMPSLPTEIEGVDRLRSSRPPIIYLEPQAIVRLKALEEGAELRLEAETTPATEYTWNVVGKLNGQDPKLASEAVLLTAHLDHLGIGPEVKGDKIYNGADDDASGVAAVLEMARALGRGKRPRRTVVFAAFGSEEKGLLGSTYYREHPTVPLKDVVANLEFEMIARPDSAVAKDTLWLSGWERSNLGPELARRGARLVADPHLEEQFFQRSDNYAFALRGVVAQTISSFGLHTDYHQPTDDLSKLDWQHMERAIESLIAPVRWLANSDFRPQWRKGKKP